MTVDSFKYHSCPMMAASPDCVDNYAGGVVNFVEHLSELPKTLSLPGVVLIKSWIINEGSDLNYGESWQNCIQYNEYFS